MNKPQDKEKVVSRREFLTTAGLIAAGTVTAGTAAAQGLPTRNVDQRRRDGRGMESFGSGIRKKLRAKYKTPTTKDRLTINELKSRHLVKQDIEVLATQIAGGIDKGLFSAVNVATKLDNLHQDMDLSNILTGIESVPNLVDSIINGMNCWGDGLGTQGVGQGNGCGEKCGGSGGNDCGEDCEGNGGDTCGIDCREAKGEECGDTCPKAPEGGDLNPFVENFMDATGSNYLDPAVNIIMQFHTAEIMRQVVSHTSASR